MKKFIPFLITFLFIFYILPLFIKSTLIILALSPILIFISALFFGVFFGFSILLAIICAVCALPLILTSGVIFLTVILGYFIITIFGNALGLIFRRKKE